ncbi:MAG: type II toxin-antitoxin system RelE/ParE family toxin [Cyclobacteriaceae bacterium]
MALEIVWTPRAVAGYGEIISYLEENWTKKELRSFIRQTNEFLELLKEYPEILKKTARYKNMRRGPINKYTILTYRVIPKKEKIELINISSSRQKPSL